MTDELVERALAAGASAAAALRPDQVATAEWVRWKCLYGCPVAGRCLTCPPHSPTPQETRRLLDEYRTVLLLRFDVHPDRAEWLKSAPWVLKTALALEQELFLAGHHKAFAIAGGRSCDLDEACGAPETCDSRERLRPGPRGLRHRRVRHQRRRRLAARSGRRQGRAVSSLRTDPRGLTPADEEDAMTPIEQIQQQHGIVGRERELATALAVLGAGRHLLLEGPVGVGKTTVALAVCDHLGRDTVRVDGDDRYSESKLTGWFDPPLVLKQGYGEEAFFAGPLVEAMQGGKVLFINELNRMPESVQNVLLPALDERLLQLPHIGEVRAADGFQVVATQNPVEYVATGHLSEALRDRFEHLALLYQGADEEAAIVMAETGSDDAQLVRTAVRLTRATRLHPRFRKGASVRGAIATVAIAERLWADNRDACGAVSRETLRRAAEAALTTRVDLRDDIDADFGSALDELMELVVERGEDPDVALAPPEPSPKA